ncbi:hypothetical protein ScPMuIL_006111 [Solemya velum]
MDINRSTLCVNLRRQPDGYGFSVMERSVHPKVMISEVSPGTTADACGLIRPGDIVLGVNGLDLTNVEYDQALKILRSLSGDDIAQLHLKTPDRCSTNLKIPNKHDKTKANGVSTKHVNGVERINVDRKMSNGLLQNRNGILDKNNVCGSVKNVKKSGNARMNSNGETKNISGPPLPEREYQLNNSREENNNYQTSASATKCCPITGQKTAIKMKNLIQDKTSSDTLHAKAQEAVACSEGHCVGSLMTQATKHSSKNPRPKEDVLVQAEEFIEQYYASIGKSLTQGHKERLHQVKACIEKTGTYDLTYEELSFGAKTAWRNAPRCIGRIQWSRLKIFDARYIKTAKEMFEALCTHVKYATNGGNIQSAITVFPQRTDGKHDFRVWNAQFIRYAGYRQPDGTVIGDPANVDFTEHICEELHWKPKGGMFDVLPLVLQANGEDPELFELPPDLVLEIPLKHPQYPWFEELNLKWFAVPGVSSMMFDCGGLEFTAAPFNGWYMGTEVGARDLCDTTRYNITKTVGLRMGLDVKKTTSLWRDRVLVEVNIAVLHSYREAGVTITDHHTASETFMKFAENEQRLRGGYAADWVWIVPPMSGSLTPVFHQEMLMYRLKPSYEYQDDPWESHEWKNRAPRIKKKYKLRTLVKAAYFASILMSRVLSKRVKCTIIYATETGKSEGFAETLYKSFKQIFNVKVVCMEDYNIDDLLDESLLLIVTSTFGSGDPPVNGENCFFPHYRSMDTNRRPFHYSVFALGSSSYSDSFCAFGHRVDEMLELIGANRMYPLAEGDDEYGQEETFFEWANGVFMAACDLFDVGDSEVRSKISNVLPAKDNSWADGKFRLKNLNESEEPDISQALSKLHNRKVVSCCITQRQQLQSPKSSRETLLVKMEAVGATLQSDISYEPGDHVGIYAANSPKLVDIILEKLVDTQYPDQLVQLEVGSDSNSKQKDLGEPRVWESFRRMPPCTLRTAFSRFIDITTPPSQATLKMLATLATGDCADLSVLATDIVAYEEWKRRRVPNFADVLEEFPSLMVPSTFVLTQLPLLQHRFYSISSSPEMHRGEIHATVSVIQYQSEHGVDREGVCSSWFKRMKMGETIPCFTRQTPAFHMPDDRSLPIIMVGPGTGIAPFRGFWQQRSVEKVKTKSTKSSESKAVLGKAYLYFGCRQSSLDNIYAREIESAKNEGSITGYHVALSREPGKPKTYVQDVLRKNKKQVYDLLVNKGAHLYICGDVGMAADVTDTIVGILKKLGKMTLEQATIYVSELKNAHRLHKDIFGAKLHGWVGIENDVGTNKKSQNKRKQH